jgi:phage terminase small subunit
MAEKKNRPRVAPGLTEQNVMFLDFYRTDPERRYAENYMRAYPRCKKVTSARVNACQILGKQEAQDYLEMKASKAMDALDMQEEDILRDLIKLKDMCMGKTRIPFAAVTKDGELIEETVFQFHPGGAKGALELLGKNKKMFTDKVEATGAMSVSFNFNLSGKKEQ